MVQASYMRFTQSCPTCGRRVQIRASLMGCTVACQHCKAEFVANPNREHDSVGSTASLMERVERALGTETTQPVNF